MKLTLEMLKEKTEDQSIIDWFIEQNETDLVLLINKSFESGREEILDFFNRRIAHLLDRTGKIKYAVFAAEQVIGIFEKKYPDDKRPREAIEAAKKVIENDTKENQKSIAHSAEEVSKATVHVNDGNISYATERAAEFASTSVYAAACVAANDAANDAECEDDYDAFIAGDTIYAYECSKDSAYANAAYSAYLMDKHDHVAFISAAANAAYGMRIKILRYGITLIEEMDKK